MKKSFILTLLMSLILFCSCTSCLKEKPIVKENVPFNVENVISTDKEAMYLINKDYKWFETLILLNNYLDEENDGSIAEIVNIFQVIKDNGKSFDTKVYKFQHLSNGTCLVDSINGFWIEDVPLVDSLIKVSYDNAYALINQVNLPKPHSRHICLRNPLGPKPCNPQWVFGNIQSQIWIDAVDGKAKSSNPAFPDGLKYAFNW